MSSLRTLFYSCWQVIKQHQNIIELGKILRQSKAQKPSTGAKKPAIDYQPKSHRFLATPIVKPLLKARGTNRLWYAQLLMASLVRRTI
jgi:hypothetical protein